MTAPKAPRQQKTPRQRAEETLAVAQRKRDRLHKEARKRRGELEALDREFRDAEARLAYAKADPALKTDSTNQTQTVKTGSTATTGGTTA